MNAVQQPYYQIERAAAGTESWEQTAPQFTTFQDALKVLAGREIEHALSKTGPRWRFRLTKDVRTVEYQSP